MSIEVRLKCFGSHHKGFTMRSIEDDFTTLRAFLKLLAKEKATEYIKDGCVVSVNKELITDDAELKDKDEIIIMPMIHGG